MAEIKLDLKDKKILSVIETDGRLSYAEIAKKVGLSKQVVKYRMDLLSEQNIIQEHYAIINDSKLGREIYQIYVQLSDLSEQDEIKLEKELKKHPEILSYFSSLGKWDFVFALAVKNFSELHELVQKILKPINSKVRKKAITSQIEHSYLPTKNFSELGKKTSYISQDKKEKFDDIDLEIIEELLSHGRITLVELSEKFDMSPNGIKERIKNLEKKKIIVGYKTKINYEKLGFIHSHFFLWINNYSPEFYKKLNSFLIEGGRAESLSRFLGYSDLEFRCNAKSIGDLYQLKRKLKNNFKDEINSIEILFVVRSGMSHLKK